MDMTRSTQHAPSTDDISRARTDREEIRAGLNREMWLGRKCFFSWFKVFPQLDFTKTPRKVASRRGP